MLSGVEALDPHAALTCFLFSAGRTFTTGALGARIVCMHSGHHSRLTLWVYLRNAL